MKKAKKKSLSEQKMFKNRKFERMVKSGFNQKEIAEHFKINHNTLTQWVKKHFSCTFAQYKANLHGKIELEKGKDKGQPKKLLDIDFNEVKKLAALGLTIPELAWWFNIHPDVIMENKKINKDFNDAIEIGRLNADTNVTRKLYERAIGYKHKDVHITSYKGEVTQTEITKHYPPEVGAITMWLTNRRPNDWKVKKEVEVRDISVFDLFNED